MAEAASIQANNEKNWAKKQQYILSLWYCYQHHRDNKSKHITYTILKKTIGKTYNIKDSIFYINGNIQ